MSMDMRKTINWQTILSDITEARAQLQEIEAKVKSGKPPCKEEFQVSLKHAYQHLNFSWNCRHVPTNKYAGMSEKDFSRWGEYPKDLDTL